MFDLFRSRDKAVRILLGSAAGAWWRFSMLTYLVPNYNTGRPARTTVVSRRSARIPSPCPEMQRLIQDDDARPAVAAGDSAHLCPADGGQMITERAHGVWRPSGSASQVTDAEMADAIRQMVPNLFPDGKFVGKEAYAGMLAQQNMTIDQFESDMRRQMLITRLRDIALEGTIVTPAGDRAAYRKKNEKIKIEYVKLTADKYKNESQPTAEEMQRVLQGQQARATRRRRRRTWRC